MVLAAERDYPQCAFGGIVVELGASVIAMAAQRLPTRERIADCTGELGLLRELAHRGDEPSMQIREQGCGSCLAHRAALIGGSTTDLVLDRVECADPIEGFLGDR